MSLIKDVADFHQQILKMEEQPCAPLDAQTALDRLLFKYEELTEFDEGRRTDDMVAMADALADLVYVAIGTAYMMGLPFQEIWDTVHAANMVKVSGTTKRKMKYDAIKPEGWAGPEAKIAALIKAKQDESSK